MRELKPVGIDINIDDKPRKILFTLNVVDELQEYFDKPINTILSQLFSTDENDRKQSHRTLIKVITALINEDAEIHNEISADKWDSVSEKYVGRRLTLDNLGEVSAAVLQAFTRSLPKPTETDEDESEGDDPNAPSGTIK